MINVAEHIRQVKKMPETNIFLSHVLKTVLISLNVALSGDKPF
jgi:hypothetical protein